MAQILNEVEHSYLSVDADFSLRENFELRMLEENLISGLLPLSVSDDNGLLRLHYDITGLAPLADLATQQKLKAHDIRCIILTLKHVISGIGKYLLDPSGIELRMNAIYAAPTGLSPCFLYMPGRTDTFSQELSKFLQELLTWTDHDDDQSVVLAYRLYRESLDHPSALDRLEQILVSQSTSSGSPAPAESPLPFSPGGIDPDSSSENTEEDSLVTEIREVPAVSGEDAAFPDREKGGLLHRLFQ